MKEWWQKIMATLGALNPRVKFLIGIALIILGLLALVTPLTPGSWLVFVGLELIGIRFLAWKRIGEWFSRLRKKPSEDGPENGL